MKAWQVREGAPGPDDEGIRQLIRRCYPTGGVSWERFQHWFFALDGSQTTIVVAEAEGGIVGMQPMQVVPHRFCGEAITAGVLNGVMVDPAWRRMGIFSGLIRACGDIAFGQRAQLVWTMPNARSRPGFEKLGFSFPGERRLLIWSSDVPRLIRKRLNRLLGLPVALVAGLGIGRTARAYKCVRVREVAALGDRAVAVGGEHAARWDGLIQDRSESWIRWRFAEEMGRPYRFFEILGDDGGVIAWSVITKEEREDLLVGYILDFAGVDRAACSDAIGASLRALAEWGVDLVMSVVTGAKVAGLFSGVGMCPVPGIILPKRFFLTYRLHPAAKSGLLMKLRTGDSWWTSLADWDTL